VSQSAQSLALDLNAAQGKDGGSVVVRSLGARCVGVVVNGFVCVRLSEGSGRSG